MQRRTSAYSPGLALGAVLLFAGAVGCTSDSGVGDDAPDTTTNSSAETAEAAAPGKYRTLPVPCDAVSGKALRSLLPGTGKLVAEQREQVLEGKAEVTSDDDRSAGCGWKLDAQETQDTTYQLRVGFERVVSYDPEVSDDDRAEQIYLERELAAELPDPEEVAESASASPGASESESGADSGAESGADSEPVSDKSGATEGDKSGDSGDEESADAEPSETPVPPELLPRTLDELGDAAFIDDELAGADSDAPKRKVTVAFRTSNVLVTVEYDQRPAPGSTAPSSENMQKRVQSLASSLAARFDG